MFQDRNCEMAPLLDGSGYAVPHNSFICQQISLVVEQVQCPGRRRRLGGANTNCSIAFFVSALTLAPLGSG